MTLHSSLKFVQGAIKKNKINPELEHYEITGGQIVGFNGYMAIGSPIDLDITARPKADLFYRALEACDDEIDLRLASDNRLHIKSGAFSAYVPCTDEEIYQARPEGQTFLAPVGFGAACRMLYPIISEDATRPWAMGLGWVKGCLQATNNLIIIQKWLGGELPSFNCPRFAVAEIARVGVDPISLQISDHSITFHFEDGRWIRTQRLNEEWPQDIVDGILDKQFTPAPVPDGLFKGLHTLAAFVPEETTAVRFEPDQLTTGNGDAGATVSIPGLPGGPIFSRPILSKLEGIATAIDFGGYPGPCGFYGDNCRGVILGLRA